MNLWDKAKLQARISGRTNDWAFILQKYKDMGGIHKSVYIVINQSTSELLGLSSQGNPLIKSASGEITELSNSDYQKSKKIFKSSQDNMKLFVNQK